MKEQIYKIIVQNLSGMPYDSRWHNIAKDFVKLYQQELRSELLKYDEWYYSAPASIINLTAEQLVDEYLKQNRNGRRN